MKADPPVHCALLHRLAERAGGADPSQLGLGLQLQLIAGCAHLRRGRGPLVRHGRVLGGVRGAQRERV